MTNFESKIIRENSHKNTQNIQIKREINTYYFHQFWTCKNITKLSKTYQEHIVIFFEIFVKKLKRTGGPNSKNRGAHSKKVRKLKRKQKSQGYPAQTHTGGWIRISRTPLGHWIDLDPLGSRSNSPKRGALDRVKTRPVQRLYKRF